MLLRWCLPIERPDDQRRALLSLWHKVPVYTRPIGGVASCHASRQPLEAWFTLFTTTEHGDQLTEALRDLFQAEPRKSVAPPGGVERRRQPRSSNPVLADPILGEDLAWYRQRLHQVSDIALSIRDDAANMTYRMLRVTLDTLPDPALLDRFNPPAPLYETELRRRLIDLAGPAMERAPEASEKSSSFWTDFVRRPHRNADVLSPPGHLLWELMR
jgi:hypothetical protein